ncbi:flagellar motor switch protein FliN [Nocardioides nematodiphilus]|uniref:flagellar motor switch protein FliN n=1 Tax=Nocardioides nematodiphilus TaxID=2849669 RepID=UPI001CD9A944|nr:flagellar motor switch protein FliN [Nocardioides nematodiphilus]MCA1984280.1 flagellar motor switch protein FliN [Nocardioides nematodiphilus]
MTDISHDDLAAAAAEAAAAVLPSATPLSAGPAQPGSPFVTAAFAGATIADLAGPVSGRIAVLVGKDLVDALADSPLGGLDLAAATQPALDAAANILGAQARPATEVDLALVVNDLGGEFTTVPLIGAGIAAAVLVPQATLQNAQPNLSGAPLALDLSDVLSAADAADSGPAAAPAAPAPAAVSFDTPLAAAPPGSGMPRGMQAPAGSGAAPAPVHVPVARGIEMLHGVDMEVTVELGRTRMTVRDLLALSPGAVLELDRAAGSPADLLVNGRLIARGEVVVVDEDFGLRVTEILDPDAVTV